MAKGTFLAHNVAWAVLGEKMNHRSQASANSNSGAWPFSAAVATSGSSVSSCGANSYSPAMAHAVCR